MNLPSWLELRKEGIYCTPGDFYLDPFVKVGHAVVSHAHGDHYKRGHSKVWAHPSTHFLANTRFGKKASTNQEQIPFKKPFKIGEINVKIFPAGHLPGSSMIMLGYKSERVLFTGDFSIFSNPTAEPLEFPEQKVHYLISESTFGEKDHHTPPLQALENLISDSGEKSIIIGCYSLGKAQHLTQLISDSYPEITILVHPKIKKINSSYREIGFLEANFQYYKSSFKRKNLKFVYLIPPTQFASLGRSDDTYKVFASGWDFNNRFPHTDGKFDFSDHPDKSQILNFIKKINPEGVGFVHGYPQTLISTLQDFNIPAQHLKFPVK